MIKEYLDLNDLKQDYPIAIKLVLDENKMQFPHAKFVRAIVGRDPLSEENDDDNNYLHLMALFDLGTPNMLLWAWVPYIDRYDPWIDEYYEITPEQQKSYLNLI